MKILFKVAKIAVYTNSVTNEEFVSISLFKEVKKEINGCSSVGRKYAEHACPATTLEVGDDFLFDSDLWDMRKVAYFDKDDVEKFANKIYLRADVA